MGTLVTAAVVMGIRVGTYTTLLYLSVTLPVIADLTTEPDAGANAEPCLASACGVSIYIPDLSKP